MTGAAIRGRRVALARLTALVALGLLLAVDVYANIIGDHSYDAGGDCGGKGCMNPGTDRGFQIGLVLLALMALVIAWPRLARRFREGGESSSL